jgi:hypothetical protein
VKTKLIYALVGMVSLLSVARVDAATIVWQPTDGDVNFIYTTVAGFNLAIFDVDDFDTSQTSPLLLNTGTGADTIDIVAAGIDFSATSSVTGNTTTLFNDSQFVIAITDGVSWFEPVSYFETAPGSNIYQITFSNGLVTSIDAVPTVVPVPAAAWLFGSGLIGLVGVARRRARVAA